MKKLIFLSILVLVITFSFVGCGSDSPGGSNGESGSLSVYLTDVGPPARVSKIEITVNEIDVTTDAGPNPTWSVVSTTPVTVNILNLRFTEQLLKTIQLPVGTYQKLRLKIGVDPATAITTEQIGCYLYSGLPSEGVVLTLNDVTVSNGGQTDLLIDIDAGKIAGTMTSGSAPSYWKYYLNNDAVRVALKGTFATIRGHLCNSSIPPSDIDFGKVELQQSGITVFTTYTLGGDLNGAHKGDFIFEAIPPGIYTIQVTSIAGSYTSSLRQFNASDYDLGILVLQ